MVGYRNCSLPWMPSGIQLIRHSDGGVPEHEARDVRIVCTAYQAFRWWGTGTVIDPVVPDAASLSGIPMVGYRNGTRFDSMLLRQLIRHSDGGVPELPDDSPRFGATAYQAFRWWGTGTVARTHPSTSISLSGIPMVGYRNSISAITGSWRQLIRHSDGGVPERQKLSKVRPSSQLIRHSDGGVPEPNSQRSYIFGTQLIRHSDGGVPELI